MGNDLVITLSGPDRVGIVEDVTKAMLGLGGNIGTSRMARLGGEFAVIMLVSLPAGKVDALDGALASLVAEGYRATAIPSRPVAARVAGSLPYRIEVEGADHEGIIHEIAHGLSQRGISIESAETWTSRAPVTGTPLFCMNALVSVPAGLDDAEWIAELEEAARQANVDVKVSVAETA